jgi:hypothetical protein
MAGNGLTDASPVLAHGKPPLTLQELGGWESSEMVRRYPHLAAGSPRALRTSPLVLQVPSRLKTTAQNRHRGDRESGVAISQKRFGIGAVEWSRSTDLLTAAVG